MQWSLFAFLYINAAEEVLDIIEIMMNLLPTPMPKRKFLLVFFISVKMLV
jgi:hypothetical protein